MEPQHAQGYRSAISLHGHTSKSKESLKFVAKICQSSHLLRWLMTAQSQRARRGGIEVNWKRGYWTPPLNPKQAYQLERGQIESQLQREAFVSLTDHESIEATQLLRIMGETERVPLSMEWTVPFDEGAFHLGIHNLPPARAVSLAAAMNRYTAAPEPKFLCEILGELHANAETLVVFNHPLWNLYGLPESKFQPLIGRFLQRHGQELHAFELNGMRPWNENRRVAHLAAEWNQLPISGGDRHGCEPNACLNLSQASEFAEFVHEIRIERNSHVLFMPQYLQPFGMRCFQTFLDVVREYPEFPVGMQHWDHRVFHPGADGVDHSLSELWAREPIFLRELFSLALLFGDSMASRLLTSALSHPPATEMIPGGDEPETA